MNYKIIKNLILIIILLSFFACEKEVEIHNIDSEIMELMILHDLPSISACAIKNDAIVWEKSYGYSNAEEQIPATSETIYHVASVSKLIVATAFMQLVEQGLINIDADINNYIPISLRNPKFPDIPITSRMLLTHSSSVTWPQTYQEAKGLWDRFEHGNAPSLSEWIPQFLVPGGEYYNSAVWKDTKPGEFELYSNIGTNILAYIVEQLTGEDFRNYCTSNIFIPLNMINTSYNYPDLDEEKVAILYSHNNSVIESFDERIYASGLLKTSVEDLSHFIISYINGGIYKGNRILEESTVNQMLEIQSETSGVCLLWRASLGNWFGHTGCADGAGTIAEFQRDDNVGLIIFCNKHTNLVYQGHEIYGLVRQKANEYRD